MAWYDYFGNQILFTTWSSNKIFGSVGAILNGTNGSDDLVPNGSTTIVGGDGDDTYEFIENGITIIEQPGGGIDTVWITHNYILAENLENLGVWNADTAIGNSKTNFIKGSNAGQTIDGAGGDDVLYGAGGSDVFQFSENSGYDVIADFDNAPTTGDLVRLTGYTQFTSFAQIQAAMRQSANNVVLQLDADNAVKFLNKQVSHFTEENFQLGLDISNFSLVFEDEFDTLSLWNGESGAASSGTWRTDYGWGETRDSLESRQLANEEQIFVDANMLGAGSTPINYSPFTLGDDSTVTITAAPTPEELKTALYDQPYVSGLLSSRESFSQTYGYFEARVDIPSGSGLWPLFWLARDDGTWPPEIDILENLGGPTSAFTVHSGTRDNPVKEAATVWDLDIAEGFHTWGLLWTPDELAWYLDGVEVFSTPTPAGMHESMYVLIDLAVKDGTPPGLTGDMTIDYVRVYSLEAPVIPTDPEPVDPEPVDPDPVDPDPVDPDPVDPEPVDPEPVDPEPVDPKPVDPDPVDPEPVDPDPVDPEPVDPDPVDPDPVDPDPVDPDPVDPDPEPGSGAHLDYVLPVDVADYTFSADTLNATGNALDNVLTGNSADNAIIALDGDDTLLGLIGNDYLNGGEGNDHIDGGAGADEMRGGRGTDKFYVDDPGDTVLELKSQGNDTVYASVNFTLGDHLENLIYTGTEDWTGTGNDRPNDIFGGDGNDVISTHAHKDDLTGGLGADTLSGGADRDYFHYNSIQDFGDGSTMEVITDFSSADGELIWMRYIDANANTIWDEPFSWIGTTGFSGAAGQLRYEISGGNAIVSGDVDGDSLADFHLQLLGVTALAATDFFL